MSEQSKPDTGYGISKSEQFSELVRCLTRPVLTIGLVAAWLILYFLAKPVPPELPTLATGLATWWFADRSRREQ